MTTEATSSPSPTGRAVPSVDRNWRKAIVRSTAWLPRPLRVRARAAALARLQRALLARADVVLIRHPKTGGTWLRVLLTHLYAQHYGTSLRRALRSDELARARPGLPRFLITSGYQNWERLVAAAFERDDPALRGKKVLFLGRHPGDVAVSWHRQYTLRTTPFKHELTEAEFGPIPLDIGRFDFVQHPGLGLPAVIAYHNLWARLLKDRPNTLLIRYEELLADTAGTLARIAALLGEPFSADEIAAAVAFGAADNLRELERGGFFQNRSLRLRDPDNPDTLKVRRARPGGYRADLEPAQAAWVDEQIARHLDPFWGYRAEAGGAAA